MSEFVGLRISVIDPVHAAIERVKLILFRPFNLERWFIIGFCAWLASLGQSGGGGGGSGNFQWNAHSGEQLKHEIAQYLPIIIAVGAVLLVVGIAVHIVFLWLSSRGRFMFLHCVAENAAQVKVPWRRYRVQGNSLFLFRLAVGFIALFCVGLLVAGAIVLGITFGRGAGPLPIIVVVAVSIPVLLLVVLVFTLIGKFTEDFVVPLMALRGCTCVVAWHEFMALLGANKGRFTLYILFQIVISLAVGMIVLVVVLATCCCAGCIMAIPYIGVVFLLPLHVFSRSYSLLYMAQYGPAYNAIALPPAPAQPDPYAPPPVQGL
jgi:hypothetical protein